MIKGKQPVYEEGADIDRISSLPRDVLDRILELTTTQEAARTCVLSSKWRYIWANHPTLVVDEKFWNTLKQKKSFQEFPVGFVVDTLNRMFVHHIGQINKFVLYISVVSSERHCDLDLWLSFLSRRGVKVLQLENSIKTPYTLPSCVFSNSDLTDLSLYNCILRIAKASTALHKLKSLNLDNLTLCSCVLVTPLLSSLTLKRCLHHFIISAPRLVSLTLSLNDDLNLVPYLTCSDIEFAYIYMMNKEIKHQGDGQQINLMNLLSCWAKILMLVLDGPSLKYFATCPPPEEFQFKLSLGCLVLFFIDFDPYQIAWILCILQKSPLLRIFHIWFSRNVDNDLEVVNYLEEPNITNHRMEQLRVVNMANFAASRAELLFTKILLSSAPSLERMLVEEDENLELTERLRILKELMELSRASPDAKIIFRPKIVPGASLFI